MEGLIISNGIAISNKLVIITPFHSTSNCSSTATYFGCVHVQLYHTCNTCLVFLSVLHVYCTLSVTHIKPVFLQM